MRRCTVPCAVLAALIVPFGAAAQAINSNVALPIAEGEGIWRSQLRYLRATDDPADLGRDLSALLAPQTLVYGITPRLTVFATLPILAHRKRDLGDGRSRHDQAIGDLRLLGRYMLLVDDYAPLSTRRIALLGGLKFPTGADRFGTPSYDPIVGGVATWAANRHEIDLDLLYRITTERHGTEAGDLLRYDFAYRYRVWPARFEHRTIALHGVIELNGSRVGHTRVDGRTARDSGGHLLFVSPGVQFVTRRLIVEASVQIPILQDLNGPQLESDFTGVLSLRLPFDFP